MHSIVLQLSLTSKDICLTLVERASKKHPNIVELPIYHSFLESLHPGDYRKTSIALFTIQDNIPTHIKLVHGGMKYYCKNVISQLKLCQGIM